jgi:carbon storage regulator
MLVLSRKPNQVIRIGDEISITVIEIRGNKVRIGIDAPTSIKVHREEVYDAIQRAKQAEQSAP